MKKLHFTPLEFNSLHNTERSFDEKMDFLAFSICVANTSAVATMNSMEKFFNKHQRKYSGGNNFLHNLYYLPNREWVFKDCGFRFPNVRIHFMVDAYLKTHAKGMDLTNFDDILSIKGVGQKTARFFLLYTIDNAEYVVFDRHIWRWVRNFFDNVPKDIPASPDAYREREQKVIKDMMPAINPSWSCAEFDYYGWKNLRDKKDNIVFGGN